MAVVLEISSSLDGYVAGPNQSLDEPLGEGGERLHDWVVRLASWRERHGKSGGERKIDDEIVQERLSRNGATVMGRRMFSSGSGAWEDDPKADGWWGDDPPFHHPVFVLTHHEREPLPMQGGTTFTFVTDGVESAIEQAKAAAGDKDVNVAGGAEAAQEALKAGLVDEVLLHVVPIMLGGGARLFAGLGGLELEKTEVVDSDDVTHMRFRVKRGA